MKKDISKERLQGNTTLVDSTIKISNLSEDERVELQNLLTDPEFIDFVNSISNEFDDGITFDELLSSKSILRKAIRILERNTEIRTLK